jgi:hypothetical protein
LYDSRRTTSEYEESRIAIQQIGSNAIPSLLKWIQYEEPGWRAGLGYWLEGGPRAIRQIVVLRRIIEGSAGVRARMAVGGFEALDVQGWPAVTELARILSNARSALTWQNAKYALANLPGDKVLLLAEGLTNRSAPIR